MKKLIVLVVALAAVFAMGSVVSAATVDGLFMYKISETYEVDGEKTDAEGFMTFDIGAEAELYPNIVVDGRFLFSDSDDDDFGFGLYQAGARYRLMAENGVEVHLGGGVAGLTGTKVDGRDLTGFSVYGKAHANIELSPEFGLYAEGSYAPGLLGSFNFDDLEGSGQIMRVRGGVTYDFTDMIGLQVGLSYTDIKVDDFEAEDNGNNGGAEEVKINSLLGGAGVVIRF